MTLCHHRRQVCQPQKTSLSATEDKLGEDLSATEHKVFEVLYVEIYPPNP